MSLPLLCQGLDASLSSHALISQGLCELPSISLLPQPDSCRHPDVPPAVLGLPASSVTCTGLPRQLDWT